jgi:hypothetical protein
MMRRAGIFVWRASLQSFVPIIFCSVANGKFLGSGYTQTGPILDLYMKKLTVLLVLAGSLLTACATRDTTSPPPYGAQPKPAAEGYCPPTQAIKGLC